MLSAFRASPPAAATISSRTSSPSSAPRASSPRRTIPARSSRDSGESSNSWQRDNRAEFTSKYGFSVVAPISVTRPDSTAGSRASCWALLNRWISSRNRIVFCPVCPRRCSDSAITLRTSAIPTCTANSSSKWACVVWATIRASVVLPVPGGPKKIIDPTRSSAIARCSALPSPTTSCWPANSSSTCGRTRWGSGAKAPSRLPAASAKRSSAMVAAYTGSVSTAGAEKVRLGGMALRNGIFVHSFDHWAAAVRTPEGELRLASGRKPEIPERLLAVPGVRGVARIAEIAYLLPIVRSKLPEARLPLEGATTLGALVASVALSRAIRRTSLSPLPAELLGAGLSLAPALASLRGSQVAGYHGAEHKAIGGYEHGEAAADATKEHERCGSHMVGPMLAATVVGNLAVSKLPPARRGPARLAANLAAI